MRCMTCCNRVYRFEGTDGAVRMQDVMKMFRFGFKNIGDSKVGSVRSLSGSETGEVMTEALEYRLEDGSTVLIKPDRSGQTIEVSLETDEAGGDKSETAARIWNDIENIIYIDCRAGYCCE